MQHLIAYARAEKIERLYGCLLVENTTMLRMCREFGFHGARPGRPRGVARGSASDMTRYRTLHVDDAIQRLR
jgi:hypothetical protein